MCIRDSEEAEINFHIIANIKIKKSDPDYKDFVEAVKTVSYTHLITDM